MSTLKVEEKIVLAASVERVWRFLLDPHAVAPCLPGARLDAVEDERTFTGTMKVKVGPVTTEFKGRARFTEIVEAERRVEMTASGDDKGGSGSAKMVMQSRVVATEGGGSELVVVADVDLAGKLVRFGRGMMEGIGKQLFKQFAERVQRELSVAPAAVEVAAPAPVETAAAGSVKVEDVSVEAEEPPAPPPVEAPPVALVPVEPVSAFAEKPSVQVENAPLDAGSLVFRAFWDWLKGLFGRLFGRRRSER